MQRGDLRKQQERVERSPLTTAQGAPVRARISGNVAQSKYQLVRP